MPEERISYIINDARCESALNDFGSAHPVDDWVWKHLKLYNDITIRPEGLPPIAQCHYHGEYFRYISEFHALFKKAMDEIDDPFDD